MIAYFYYVITYWFQFVLIEATVIFSFLIYNEFKKDFRSTYNLSWRDLAPFIQWYSMSYLLTLFTYIENKFKFSLHIGSKRENHITMKNSLNDMVYDSNNKKINFICVYYFLLYKPSVKIIHSKWDKLKIKQHQR